MGKYKLLLETNDHCVLCLKNKEEEPEVNCDSSDGTKSFRNICHYLKTNLTEVFSGSVTLFSNAFPVLEQAELEGTLCSECNQLSEHFSGLFLELEVIQMKLQECLRLIHRKVAGLDKEGQRLEEVMLGRPGTQGHHGIVDRLRKKISEGCRAKLDKGFPRLILTPVDAPVQTLETEAQPEPVAESAPQVGQEVKFPCQICRVTFPNKWTLGKHVSSAHGGGRRYPCRFCSKVFTLAESRGTHMRLHCPVRNEGGRRSKNYSKNVLPPGMVMSRSRKCLQKGRFKCDHCSKPFAHDSSKWRHEQACPSSKRVVEAVQEEDPLMMGMEDVGDAKPTTDSKGKGSICRYCLQIFAHGSTRWRHEKTACALRPNQGQGQAPPKPTDAGDDPLMMVKVDQGDDDAATVEPTSGVGDPIDDNFNNDDLGNTNTVGRSHRLGYPPGMILSRKKKGFQRAYYNCQFCLQPFAHRSSKLRHQRTCSKRHDEDHQDPAQDPDPLIMVMVEQGEGESATEVKPEREIGCSSNYENDDVLEDMDIMTGGTKVEQKDIVTDGVLFILPDADSE